MSFGLLRWRYRWWRLFFWPGRLLNKGKSWLGFGLAVLLVVPVVTLYLYQGVGTPEGLEMQPDPHQAAWPTTPPTPGTWTTCSGQMEARLNNNPEDLEGWMLLGRSYKAVQQYPAGE